jgi:hypothetical protein
MRRRLIDTEDATVRPGAAGVTADVGGLLTVDATEATNTGGGNDTLFSYDLPAGLLTVTGRGVRFRGWGATADNANAKTLHVVIGGAGGRIYDLTLTANAAHRFVFEAMLIRTGTNEQLVAFTVQETAYVGGLVTAGKQDCHALTDSEYGVIPLGVTAEGVADNDISLRLVTVEAL